MRKVLLFIPAMLLAATVSATPIGPNDPEVIVNDVLTAAINAASANDVIELSSGVYNETNRLPLSKNITIKAAENAVVTIKLSKDNQLTNGAKVTFDGVIIDCSTMGDYSYIFRSYDASEGKEFHLNNCEVKNCSKDYFFCALYVGSDKRLMDSCVIDGCHFHNMTAGKIIAVNGTDAADKVACKGIAIRNSYFENCANSAVYVSKSTVEGTESCNSVIVKNSTFAGFSALDHSVIDVNNYGNTEASTIEVNVDHCTFYNNTIPDGYGCIRSSRSTNLSISNCIFANIDPIERYATYCYGGSITNCLVHNFKKGHRTEEGFTPANNIVANPYFLNVEYESYDFTLAPSSPARNAGTGSSNIGDPRWQTDYSDRATTKNITATSNALKNAVDAAWPGDVIILADGEYTQGDNYTVFDKNLLIKAADGASPVIKFTVPAQLKQGARAEFKGLKFDMTDLHGQDWYEHLISAEDASDGNKLIFEKCEFYNDAANNSTIHCAADKKLDSLVVNNCKFYDSHKSCIFLANTGLKGLKVTNSTFANITTEDGSYYAGVIDIRTTTGSLHVDHCTFYNVKAMNTDYAAIGKVLTSDAIVSNCIFAMPTSTGSYRTIRDHVTANNCLVYNYTNESGYGMQGDVTKSNCIKNSDPLFTDADEKDFSYPGDWTTGNVSPARGKGTDGSDLGDKNWYTDETIPSTNFASPYALTGTIAVVSDKMEHDGSNIHSTASGGSATWKIHSTKACAVQVTLNLLASYDLGHDYQVEIFDKDNTSLGALSEGGYHKSRNDSLLSGSILLPKIGDYKIVLTNNLSGSTTSIKGVTLSYVGGAVQNVTNSATCTTDINEAWFSANGSRADSKISFDEGTMSSAWARWNIHVENSDFYNVKVIFNEGSADHIIGIKIYNTEKTVYDKQESRSSAASPLDLGRAFIPAGDYVLEYTNNLDWSTAKLISVQIIPFIAPTIALPANLKANDAILSELAYAASDDADETAVYFTPSDKKGYILDQWAKWKVSVASAGTFLFTMNVSSTNEQSYKITILDSEDNELESFAKNPGSGDKTIKHYFNLAAGNYFVMVQNTTNHSAGYIVNLGVTQPELVTLDEAATEISSWESQLNVANVDVKLIRTLRGGMYNTLVLPFAISSSQVKDIFGADVKIYTLKQATVVDDYILNLELNLESSTYQGTPLFVKPANDVVNPVFVDVTIKTTSVGTTTKTNANFTGTFVATTLGPSTEILFLAEGNMLYYPQDEIPILGMRGWLVLHDYSGPAGAVRRYRIINEDQTATDIEMIDGNWMEMENTRKFIENGQLVIVRDGTRYNVMGIRVE